MTLSKVVGDLQRLGMKRSRLESPGVGFFPRRLLKKEGDATVRHIDFPTRVSRVQKYCNYGF